MTVGYHEDDFTPFSISIAMTSKVDRQLADHLDRGPDQEDLTFGYWRPSCGARRFTAIVSDLILPTDEERELDGNVAFTRDYLARALRDAPSGTGLFLAHSHLGPGWQGMSEDDEVAERDRLAGAVAGATGLPIVGLTRATDGEWSGRIWVRASARRYVRRWASTVRVVGDSLRISFHPSLRPAPTPGEAQVATVSAWGRAAQDDIVRAGFGIVGLGSVGSIAADGVSRMGVEDVTYIDHDFVEKRNLDRTSGAHPQDVEDRTPKVDVAARAAAVSHTAEKFTPRPVNASLLSDEGLAAALDCDLLLCCVDRPWPRHVLQVLAASHLIPVVDGGILARVNERGLPLHVDWRIQTVAPDRACLYCLGTLRRSDVGLDQAGLLDDPDYIASLPAADRELYARRNVYAFSLSVASHQLLQAVGLVADMPRVGGVGSQHYQAYPGVMTVNATRRCEPDCEVAAVTALAVDPL